MGRVGNTRRGVFVRGLLFMLIWSVLPAPAAGLPGAAAPSAAVRVPILAYHGVDHSGSAFSITPEQLAAQCQWLLENGYTTITLGQFWDAAMGFGQMPPNPIVFTIDDGLPSALAFADILGRYGMVGTYFINNVSFLTPDQILSLAQRGAVEAHTVSHASLPGMDYESQLAEIAQNKAYLEQITGQPVRFLAWPFGSYDATSVQAAAAAGIVAAVALGGTAANTGALDPYAIPRIMPGAETDLAQFSSMVMLW